MTVIQIKANDTARKIADTLKLNDAAINLSGCTVTLIISDGKTATRRVATITNAANGAVEVQLLAADVDTPGRFVMEWEVVFANQTHLTVPTDGHYILSIVPDLT